MSTFCFAFLHSAMALWASVCSVVPISTETVCPHRLKRLPFNLIELDLAT